MNYQLIWDEDTQSGYVRNNIYPKGYVFEEIGLKPETSFLYESMVYDQTKDIYTYTVNGVEQTMTSEEILAVLPVCAEWIDTTYVDTPEAFNLLKVNKKKAMVARFNGLVSDISPYTEPHEMDSWRIQSAEATAFTADSLTPTPFIDALLASRAFNETKEELVASIITKSSDYSLEYATILGQYHKVMSLLDAAENETELTDIVWA